MKRYSLLILLALSATAFSADEVLERIKPIGQVNIAGQKAAAPAAAPAAEPAAPAQAAETASVPAAETAPAPAAEPAQAAAPSGQSLYVSKGCGGCHGADGKSTPMPTYPKLAGQQADYLLAQMKDIKSGARANGQTMMMKGIIAGVSEDEMKAIAEWLASQPAK